MSGGGFLERWSRRKLAEGRVAEPGKAEEAPEPTPPVAEEPVEETLGEAELARLPSLESFTLKTDLSPFLRKGVPDAIRNAALRKMWMLDPAIRDHKDLAVDYAWDWNTPGGVPGNAGTISRESLARMLDSLNPRPRDPETPSQQPAEETVAGQPEDEQTAAGGEIDPPAPGAATPVADTSAADAPPAADRMPRKRRHGGAAPV